MSGAEGLSARSQRTRFSEWTRERVERWLAKHVPAAEQATLHRSNIFILPASHGLLFILTAVVIFVAAINYGLSLAFALAFLMISLFLLAILHSFYNLRGLMLRGLGAEPTFAGETAVFIIAIQGQSSRSHESLGLHLQGGDTVRANLIEQQEQRLCLSVPTVTRGRFKAPRLIIESSFPLGLWRAWSRLDLAQTCIVYPRPLACNFAYASNGVAARESTSTVPGVEDFHSLRAYQSGDSLKQIAWKNLARGQGLMVKQFVAGQDEERILDWDMFPGLDSELRLSYLCYMALQLENSDCNYGLLMPGLSIPPNRGEVHQRRILETLALWP